jgi:hypothetical protein
MEATNSLLAFNRGMVSRLALARIDIKRMALSAEEQTNWMPRVMGSMMLRPGLEYVATTKDDDPAVLIPFVFSTDDTAVIELTPSYMRVLINDVAINWPSVSTTLTNSYPFVGSGATITDWTDNDESGGVSVLLGSSMSLTGNGTAAAIRTHIATTVSANDQPVLHCLKVIVAYGRAKVRIGTSAGGAEIMADTVIRSGYHMLGFTPGASPIYVQFSNSDKEVAIITSARIEPAGDMAIVTPWSTEADLQSLRYDQSGDVIFVASADDRTMRIERQGDNQWSCVEFFPLDGPFMPENLTSTTVTPSAITGLITLTASRPIFTSGNAGGLFKIDSNGQQVTTSITSIAETWTQPIRVTGIDNGRLFSIILTGFGTGTIWLQRSVGEPGDWVDVASYTGNTTTTYDDTLDNQIIYYRIGCKASGWGSGTLVANLFYAAGSITGICRITGYTSSTVVSANVLDDLGSTSASTKWSEGSWSPRRGYPTSVCIYDGRLWLAGKDYVYGSVSDAYESFDQNVEGDSGPIIRSIGSGPVDSINWLLPVSNLILGAEGSELLARASQTDEPLTPTAFSLKPISTQGSTSVRALRVDTSGVFVHRNRSRVYELAYDGGIFNYTTNELTAIIPEIGGTGIVRAAVQRQPDTRLHFVRDDGKVAVLVFDKTENVTCWILVETDGEVEDVIVLPDVEEDLVYYVVKRTIDNATKRFIERWAMESEAQGGTTNKLADCLVTYSGASTTTITTLGNLESKDVCVWGNGKDLGTYTVESGTITLTEAVTLAYIGLPYEARFKSSKLALMFAHRGNDTPLNQRSKIDHLGLVLADTHAQGIQYGPDFNTLDDLPQMEGYEQVDPDSIWDEYNAETFEFNGEWTTDSRVCLRAASPRPVTVLAAIINGGGNTK